MVLCELLCKFNYTGCISRAYSQYARHFVPPIYEKKKLDQIAEAGELESYKHVTVKAAQDNESYSVLHDVVLSKMVNYIMQDGRKETAKDELAKALTIVKRVQVGLYNRTEDEEEKKKIVVDPVRIFKVAVQNCRPILKLTPIRRGGSTYQVPVPISDGEQLFRAMRGLVLSSREKEHTTRFHQKLAQEILDAFNNRGRVVKQKQELHKTCEANRAYAHYRWA